MLVKLMLLLVYIDDARDQLMNNIHRFSWVLGLLVHIHHHQYIIQLLNSRTATCIGCPSARGVIIAWVSMCHVIAVLNQLEWEQ